MHYKDFAISIAKQAGKIMRQNFKSGVKKHWKSDNSPVTQTDIAINKLIIDKIKKQFPDYSILGEEASFNGKNKEMVWVCDPVDGTSVFSHGIPISTFSLALVENGKPILGLIYDPFMDRLYFAEFKKGASLNNKPIHVSQKDLDREFVDVENASKSVFNLWGLHEELYKLGAKVSNLHSTAYAGALVASGKFIGVILPHNTCHDAAALKIIVDEAGGKVTDLFGKEQRYDQNIKGAIISNGKVHEILIHEIDKILKK